MTPKLSPEEERRALFRRVKALGVVRENREGRLVLDPFTERDRQDFENAKKSLEEREARFFQLTEQERSDLASDQDTMKQLRLILRLYA